jgi:hypothetical protein
MNVCRESPPRHRLLIDRTPEAKTVTEQKPDLATLGNAVSAADLSILRAALEEPVSEQPVLVTTTPGSKNDLLWTAMVALGWMSHAEPLDVPVPSKVFRINPTAKQSIWEFLAARIHSEAMTKLINDLRAEIAPKLIEAVHRVDGTPADLAIMLAAVVESTMRRAIKPELHDEFLREVAKVAEAMRSN